MGKARDIKVRLVGHHPQGIVVNKIVLLDW